MTIPSPETLKLFPRPHAGRGHGWEDAPDRTCVSVCCPKLTALRSVAQRVDLVRSLAGLVQTRFLCFGASFVKGIIEGGTNITGRAAG